MFKPDERYLPVKPGTYQTKESVEYLFSKVSNTREHWQKIVDKLKGIYCWSDDLQTSWFEINMQGTIEFHGEGCGYIGKEGSIDTIPKGLYNFWDILNQVQNAENREKFLLHPFTLEGKLTGVPSPWSFIQDESGVVSLKYIAPNIVNWLRQLPGIRFNRTTGRVNDVMGWDKPRDDTPEKSFQRQEVSKDTKLSFKHFIPNSGVVEKGYEFQFTHHNVDGSWNIASYSNDRVRIENPYGFTMPNIDLENASYNSTVMPGIVPNTFTWKSEREARLEDLKRKVRAGFLNVTARVENKYKLEFHPEIANYPDKFVVKLVNPVFYTAGLYPDEYRVRSETNSSFISQITSDTNKSSRNPIGDHFDHGYISGHNREMDTPDKVLAHYKRQRLYFKVQFTHLETGLVSNWIEVPYSPITKWEKDSVYDLTDEIMARENQWGVRLYAVRNIVDVNPDGTPVYKLLNQFVIDNFGHPGTYKIKTDFNNQPQTSQNSIALNYDKPFSQLTLSQREHWNQIKYKLVEYTHPSGQGPYPFFMNEKTFTAQPSDTATYAIKSELFPNPRYWITGDMVKTTYPDGRVEKAFSNVKFHLSGHKQGRWNISVRGLYQGNIDVGRNGEAVINITNLTTDMITLLSNENNLATLVDINTWNGVEIRPELIRAPAYAAFESPDALFEFNVTEKQGEDSVITRLRNALNNVTLDAIKRLDFLQSMIRARPTYEITLPSTLPSGRYKFRLGTTEITSNGNTNKLSITNAEDRLDRLYQDGTKLTLVEYNGVAVSNIVSTVNFTETRRYLKAALKPLTDSMEITGSLTITGNGDYEQDLRLESDANDSEFNQYYRLNIDNLGDEAYEAIAGGIISDGVFRGSFTDQAKPIIRTWDPKTKPTIPVRMLGINLSSADYYDVYEDEASMNANRKGYTIQIPNRITYTNDQILAENATRWLDEVMRLGLNVDYVCTGKEDGNLKFNMYAYAEGDSLSRMSPGTVKLTTTDPQYNEYEFEGNAGQRRYLFTDTDITKPYQDDYTRYTNPTSRTMRLVQVNGKQITPIVKNIPIRRTRYFMDVSHLESLTQASITGTVTINGTRQAKSSVYSGNIEFSNIAKGHYLMEYTLNGDQSLTMNVERDPQRIAYSSTMNNFDGSSTNDIPARFTKFSNMPVGDYNFDNGSFNARPLSFTIRNNLTVKDNVTIVEEAMTIMERLKNAQVSFVHLLEDFDSNENAHFEQRIKLPNLQETEGPNIQVRVMGRANPIRLPLVGDRALGSEIRLENRILVTKPNNLEDNYPVPKPNVITFELVSVNGISVPGTPRYDIPVKSHLQFIKHNALANRVEELDITGKRALVGDQDRYSAEFNGEVGKQSYSKLPSGKYEISFQIRSNYSKIFNVSPIINRFGSSTSGNFHNVRVNGVNDKDTYPKTITGYIRRYRDMLIHGDTPEQSGSVNITLNNKLVLEDKRAQPDVGDLYNKPTGNAAFDKVWDTADIRITIFRLEGNVDTRNRFGISANMLHTYTRMPAGRYQMEVMADPVKTTNGKLVVQLPSVFGPGSNMFGRAWAQKYGVEKVGKFDYIGSPPMTDAWKTASINIPYKKIELVVNSKAKTYESPDLRYSNPIDQYNLKFTVYAAVSSLLPLKDRYTLGIISSWLELDHISNAGKIDITIVDKTFTIDPRSSREYQDKMFCPIYIWEEHQDLMVPRYNREVIPYRKNLGNGRFDTNMFQDIGYDKTMDVTKEMMIPRKIKAKITVTTASNTVWKKDVLIPVQFHVINGLNKDFDPNSREDILPRKNRKVPQFISYE